MNDLTLYQITEEYKEAVETLFDLELPEEAVTDTLEGIKGELTDKAINVAQFIRNIETAAEAIKKAESNMRTRRTAMEDRAKWLRKYLLDNMEAAKISRIECPYFRLTTQANLPSVQIIDESAIPNDYKRVITETKVDKSAIRSSIKSGQDVPGAVLIQSKRLNIK